MGSRSRCQPFMLPSLSHHTDPACNMYCGRLHKSLSRAHPHQTCHWWENAKMHATRPLSAHSRTLRSCSGCFVDQSSGWSTLKEGKGSLYHPQVCYNDPFQPQDERLGGITSPDTFGCSWFLGGARPCYNNSPRLLRGYRSRQLTLS